MRLADPRLVRAVVLGFFAVLGTACGSCSGEDDDELAPGACRNDVGPFIGEGTHYTADGTGNCSFEAPPDLMVAAMNGVDYNRAAWCGGCVAVEGPHGAVTVRIVDQCPGCARGNLDLSREAFVKIAPLVAGRVPITWRPVPCEVDGAVAYRFKAGSNASWTAIQIRNHRYPIAKLEVRDDAGAYQPITRATYNYFVDSSGLGSGPYTLRLTSTRGQVIEDVGIPLGDAVVRPGIAQFPICP